jgi:SAM-dependent methyltransferase
MSSSEPVSDFYERMYAEGREGKQPGGLLGRLFVRLRRFELHRVPATLALLGEGERLLDVGCGDGTLLARARRGKFGEVYGLDIADVVVERARATCLATLGSLQGVHLQTADLNARLPFSDGLFDAVTAVAVIEHLFDPYLITAELHRVLKPGGQLIVEVPNLAWLPRRLDVLLGRLPVTGDEEGWDGGHLHYFTFATLHELLMSHGFDVQHMSSTGIFPRVRNIWPTLLGGNILAAATKNANGHR